jgi:UDP-N-acetylglucosamine 2-epimerase (non-hydrolysing)
MKICIVVGTRPEIIKMSPVIRACDKKRVDYYILHTGQHFDYTMDKKMFEDLELPEPKYNLKVGGQEYRKQIGLMVHQITDILKIKEPETDVVLVQGDTSSVLAATLAGNKLGIKVAHHEAGLRSHDLSMLEEINRIITDHIADYLFTPTKDALTNLKTEGLPDSKIFMTGNTIVDAVRQNLKLSERKEKTLDNLRLKKKKYILVTAHRAENVDVKEKLSGILKGFELVALYFNIPVIFPIHPRTAKNIKKFGLRIHSKIQTIEPVGYLEFLQLEANAKMIITDSGGLQEEACILKVPCVTIRENTERPETIAAGTNILAGTNPEKILAIAKKIVKKQIGWINPFGNGSAGEKIIDLILKMK